MASFVEKLVGSGIPPLAAQTIAEVVGGGSSLSSGFGVPGAVVTSSLAKPLRSTSLSVGSNDLYTVPTNKIAMVLSASVLNGTGADITVTPQIKVGATYYGLNTSINVTAGNVSTILTQVSTSFKAGETLSFSASAVGLVVNGTIIEFEATNCILPVYTAFTSGQNVIYTCPPGKTAIVFNRYAPGFTTNTGASYFNASGGTRTVTGFVVPSGGTAAATNQTTISSQSVTNGSVATLTAGLTLQAGDFYSLNVDAGTAGQMARLCVIEL